MNDCMNCQCHDDCIKYFEELPEKRCERYKFDKNRTKKSKKRASLCWQCNKLDCSWIKNLEPVAGWDAIKTDVGHTTKMVL